MAVVDQIFQYRREFSVEVLDACVLVDVQVQEVAECVVVSRKAEDAEIIVQCLQHFLRSVVDGR